MSQTSAERWKRFQKYCVEFPEIDLSVDISRMDFPDGFLEKMEPAMQQAFKAMTALESGAIANPDENRMVGHYWLRNPSLAPNEDIREAIQDALLKIKQFSQKVHSGEIKGADGPFKNLLIIGIGGSALGPQFVARACGHPKSDKLKMFFLDNTDPDGMDVVYQQLEGQLGKTLCVVISKSGGTKETRNGMLETKNAYVKAGLVFENHAIAVTGDGSNLSQVAKQDKWLDSFPMWDWVGGRTSELSAVGLLPASLQGIDIEHLVEGAKQMDAVTRRSNTGSNPAALLALMWYYAGNGKGDKDMVVLPYKDRLELFSRYLQQLIMESLGKELDLDGKKVNQGIAVYGNKGSTDQHAYVQQLRDGVNNFFVTFLEVLSDRDEKSMEVESGITSGDYLFGFFMGTRQALHENQRQSVTITIKEVSAKAVGGLIALFERAVGLYASLININAYHQPGVEAGKKAAGSMLELQLKVVEYLRANAGPKRVDEIASAVGSANSEAVYKICRHLASNPEKRIKVQFGASPAEHTFASA